MSDPNWKPYPYKYDPPRPLYQIAYCPKPGQSDNTAHWALFLPHPPKAHYDTITPQQGMACHTGAIKEGNLRKRSDDVRWHVTDLGRTGAQSATMIPGAMVTQVQLRAAGVAVHNREDYKLLTNNCQHFAVQTVVELNRLYPRSVSYEAVLAVQGRGTMLVKGKSLLSWSRLTSAVTSSVRSPQYV